MGFCYMRIDIQKDRTQETHKLEEFLPESSYVRMSSISRSPCSRIAKDLKRTPLGGRQLVDDSTIDLKRRTAMNRFGFSFEISTSFRITGS